MLIHIIPVGVRIKSNFEFMNLKETVMIFCALLIIIQAFIDQERTLSEHI